MQQIRLRGIHYCYEDLHQDQSNAILLVHGHPFDHTMWKEQIESLGEYRLILPDLRGYGKTDYDFDKIFIEEHALDLVYLLDHLRIEKVHLIGLSMGGQIIVEFARLFPHRTRSLIICDSNPAGETEISRQQRLELADKMIKIGMEAYTKQNIFYYLHRDTIAEKGEAYHHLCEMMVKTPVRGAAASHRGRAERRDNFEYLSKLDKPVAVIVGGQDYFTPFEEMRKVAEAIKGTGLTVIEYAGHLPNMEQPAVFNRIIRSFLDRNNG